MKCTLPAILGEFYGVMPQMAPPDDEIPDLLPPGNARPRSSEGTKKGQAQQKAPSPSDNTSDANALAPLELDLYPDAPSSSDFGLAPASSNLQLSTPPKAASAVASNSEQILTPPDYSTMGGDVDLGDDLDFGGAASQLNMVVEALEPEREVPWPSGTSPFEDQISPDFEKARKLSGFGEPPSAIWGTPLYAWRVLSARKKLRGDVDDSKDLLALAERRRDKRLAFLAESQRQILERDPRFSSLYSQGAALEAEIKRKRADVQALGAEGTAELKGFTARLEALATKRSVQEKLRNERLLTAKAAEKETARLSAALKRIDIQHRNLQEQADKETSKKPLPTRIEAQFVVLESEREKADTELSSGKEKLKQLTLLLKEADGLLGMATAAYQAEDGKRSAILITQGGKKTAQNNELQQSVLEQQEHMANAARQILELRGDVVVEAQVREELLNLDEKVLDAFIHHQSTRLAQDSMDKKAYNQGREIWMGGAVVILLLLIYSSL